MVDTPQDASAESTANADGPGAAAGASAGADTAAGPGAGTAKPGDVPGFDKVAVVGNVVWLMTQSAAHKHMFMDDLNNLVLPPVALGQYRLWRNDQNPLAVATWAFLNEEAENRLKQDVKSLLPDDWNSGEALWLMDIIAPFGGNEKIVEELRTEVFKGRTVKSLQPAPDGKGVAVVEW